MSHIDDLIHELCPNGVEFKAVGEVTAKGSNIKWVNAGEAEFQYIDLSSVDLVTRRIGETVSITADNAPSRARQIVQTGDVLFATTRPAQMRWAVIPAEYDGQIASTGYCVLRPDTSVVLTNFLAHILGADTFRQYVEANQVAGNYPSIPDNRVRAYRIPVPPLEVQREIVRVLDQFTQLEAELEAELEARRRQYEHYQRALLAVGSSVENTPMGEIASIGTGRTDRKDATADGVFPLYVRSKDVLSSDKWEFDETAIIIPGEGGIGEIFHFVAGKYALHQRAYRVAPHDARILPRFLYFYLRENFGDYVRQRAVTATVTSLRRSMLTDFPVPLPSLEEQTRVVEALDQLDALVNDISIGLPAELAARRKQYEYYRDKLLTFKELAA